MHRLSSFRRAAGVLLILPVALLATASAAAAAPGASLDIAFAPGSPAPPVLNQSYSQALAMENTGDVALDGMVVVDTLPVQMAVSHVTTGSYTGLTDFAAGEGVRVSYEKNTALGVFTLWGSSPNTTTNVTLTAPPPGLGAGEYITRVRWEFGQAAPGMQATVRPVVAGRVVNPDNAGGPVAPGDTITNCATLTAVDLTGPTPVNAGSCENFQLIAGPAIALQATDSTPLGSAAEASATLTGGDPTGTIDFEVFAAGDATCATPLSDVEVPVDGPGAYPAPDYDAPAAGAYKWMATYSGDSMHAGASTGCNNPAGAFAVVAPPVVSAAFGAAVIDVGATTSLTFTIDNPAANTVALAGVALEDTLPAGLVVASPNGASGTCGGGTVTAVAGTRDVRLAGGAIPVGASCTVAVHVTATDEPGPTTITTEEVTSANGGSGNTATASLRVRAPSRTTLTCREAVTVGDEASCTATVNAAFEPEGTVAFATGGTGTFSAHECALEPVSATEARCHVRYTPSGAVPASGRHDRLSAEYSPADAEVWAPSAAEAALTVHARPVPPPPLPPGPPAPVTPQTFDALALSCSPSQLVLLSAVPSGRRVRFSGAAEPAAAGQLVTIRTRTGGTVAARATVRPDGSFTATGQLPRRSLLNRTHYYAQLGDRRSTALKLTRRMTARITVSAATVTISGRVAPPLGRRAPVVIRRLTSCAGGYAVVARVRPDARGRWRVTVPHAAGAGPALFRAQTRVPTNGRGGTLRTFALVLGADRAA
jgi:hypothetical protein